MHFLRSRSRAFSVLILWMGVIFLFSSMPGESPASDMPLLLLFERKGAHIFEYVVLSMLAFNAFRLSFRNGRSRFFAMLAAGLSLLYAFLDETHQLFVPGREGKLADVGIDAVGIAFGMFLVGGFLSRKRDGDKG